MRSARILRRSISNIKNLLIKRPALWWTTLLLTSRCTQRCLQCAIPAEATKDDFITMDDYLFILNRLDKHVAQVLSLSGGEPILHPQFPELVEIAAEKQFARIHVLTTLYGSDKRVESCLEAIFRYGVSMSTSFDGFGEVADRLRGAKNIAEKVMKNMRLVESENRKRKKPIKTGVNVVISKLNLHQIPDILDFLEDIGWSTDVDLYRWQSTNQIETDELKLSWSAELEKVLERVKKSPVVFTPTWLIDGFRDYLNGGFTKRCPYLDSPASGTKIYVNFNGDVKVCFGPPVGNILQQSPASIFQSALWKNRLEDIRRCTGCWNTCYTPSARIVSIDTIKDVARALKIEK